MSDVLLSFRGREVRARDVAFLRELITQNPTLSRRALSAKVCEAWNWVQPNGQPRDMICRSLMLHLHRAGHIQLPAPRFVAINNAIRHRRVRAFENLDTSPLECAFGQLGKVEIQQVRRREGEDLFNYLVKEYHYLGYSRPVGEHLKYLIRAGKRPIACMAWSSAPLQLNLRDTYIGAPKEAYRHNLHLIAYNSRYVILPWVRVLQLASHLLARVARRLSADWLECYHHPIHLLESFVDVERFKGTCYRAANWRCLGRSRGLGTKSKPDAPKTSVKELWVYPLTERLKEKLVAR